MMKFMMKIILTVSLVGLLVSGRDLAAGPGDMKKGDKTMGAMTMKMAAKMMKAPSMKVAPPKKKESRRLLRVNPTVSSSSNAQVRIWAMEELNSKADDVHQDHSVSSVLEARHFFQRSLAETSLPPTPVPVPPPQARPPVSVPTLLPTCPPASSHQPVQKPVRHFPPINWPVLFPHPPSQAPTPPTCCNGADMPPGEEPTTPITSAPATRRQ